MNPIRPIFSKWIIEGLPGFVVGLDKELYRLPFKSGRNHFGLRKIKVQNPNKYKIDRRWWSKSQLKNKVYLNPSPEILIENTDMPF